MQNQVVDPDKSIAGARQVLALLALLSAVTNLEGREGSRIQSDGPLLASLCDNTSGQRRFLSSTEMGAQS